MIIRWCPQAEADLNDPRAQGLVEYALILVLIAIVAIVGLALIGGTLNDLYYSRIVASLSK